MEINFKGLRQSECSPAERCIPSEVFCSCPSHLLSSQGGRECSSCLSGDMLPGNLDPFAQWCVKHTLEDTQIISNYHGLCCHRETRTGRVTPALQLRNLNFEPALFTSPRFVCYSQTALLCSCTAEMVTQSCLNGINAFKRLWCSHAVWRWRL